MNLNMYDFGYTQAQTYAWGRLDAGEPYFDQRAWAAHWAEIFSSDGSRPSIQDAFTAWKESHNG